MRKRLARLQDGELLGDAGFAPLPEIGANCHGLAQSIATSRKRIVYRVADDAIVILDVFSKKTRTLPGRVAAAAKRRLKDTFGLFGRTDIKTEKTKNLEAAGWTVAQARDFLELTG